MKKSVFLVVLILMFVLLPAYAKPGDIAGIYYVTDISGIVNGAVIETKNIGGYTVINAEMMDFYGFDVIWNEAERSLRINSVEQETDGNPPTIKTSNVFSGNFGGYYYETDIVTYLDGKPITAYNIGGNTYILAEEMRDFGYVVEWVEEDRNLWITSPRVAGYHYKLKLNTVDVQNTDTTDGFSVKYTKDEVVSSGDAAFIDITMNSSGQDYEFILEFDNRYNGSLIALMKELSSGGNAYPIYNEELKYAKVYENVDITINGHKAEKIAISTYHIKGDTTCYLYVRDLPNYRVDEIEEIIFSIGNVQ